MKMKMFWFSVIAALTVNVRAQVPEMFRYQGRLVEGTNLVNATLPMSFKLYDAPTNGILYYEDSNSVLVVDGLYSAILGEHTVSGSLTNAIARAAVYLELTVNGETLSPRERLFSVPYALNTPPVHERIIGLPDSTFDFGNCLTGRTRRATLTIYNDGNSPMTVTGLEFSETCFSGNWTGTLRQYGSKTVTVFFTPVLAQNYSGTITVNCDKTDGTNVITCTGAGVSGRYIDHGDGTVTDLLTELMWTKNANIGGMIWSDAVAYCENLVTNGYSDWRLPSINRDGDTAELDTLFRTDGDSSGTWEGFAETPFVEVQNRSYWSKTSSADNTDYAWCVYMNYGGIKNDYMARRCYVWPVRGGK